MKNLSVKNKTLLFVTTALIIFSLVLLGIIYQNQKNKLQSIEDNYFNDIKKSYAQIIEKHKDFYKYRLLNTINIDGVKESLHEKNRKKLYNIVKAQFDTLKDENKFLKLMHFHLPNGDSFLRVHKPEKYGDNIASRRAMAAAMHKDKKALTGFEAGIYMLAYREFMPIFYQGKYIGSVELGSRPDQVLSDIEYFTNIKGALFVKENKIIEYREKRDTKIENYTLQYNSFNDDQLIELIPKDYDFSSNLEICYGDKVYAVYPFDMLDYEGNISAKAVFFHDITSIKNAFSNTVKELVILLLGLLGLLLLVIHIGFSKIISVIEMVNGKLANSVDQLNQNKLFTESILDNSAYAIITTNKDGVITLFNKKAQEMLGYSADEMIGIQTPVVFHKNEEVIQRAKQFSEELNTELNPGFDVFVAKTNKGLENNDNWTYVDKNGGEFPVSLNITSLVDIDGNATGYLGMAEDITFRNILENSLQEQKDELQTIFDTTLDGIAMLDLEGNFLFFNNAFKTMTGYTKDELYEKNCVTMSVEEDIPKARKALEDVLKTGQIKNIEKSCILNNERKIEVSMSIALMPDTQRFLISVRDITESRAKEKEIKEFLNIIDKNIITSTTDLDGNITYISEEFCNVSGYSQDELMGKHHRIVRHPDTPIKTYESLWDDISHDRSWCGEIKNKKKDGGYFWVDATINPIFNDIGKKVGYTAIEQNITDKKIIEEISITDGLTNIYNRRHFNNIFPKVINMAKRKNELVSFVIMDIDHFKQYNDTYGHQMGDDVLINVADEIKNSLKRADDFCFRLGGEEFGVIFKVDLEDQAISFTNTIRQNIENLKIEHSGNSASSYITASMGLICKNANDIKDADEVYKLADDLLYKAKESGRNKVCNNIKAI